MRQSFKTSSCGSCHATPPSCGGNTDDFIVGRLACFVDASTFFTSGALSLRSDDAAALRLLLARLPEMLGVRPLCVLRALLSRLYALLQRLLARLLQRPVLTLLMPLRLPFLGGGKKGNWPG